MNFFNMILFIAMYYRNRIIKARLLENYFYLVKCMTRIKQYINLKI